MRVAPSFSEEHDKVRALNGANQVVGEFIEWLPSQGLHIAEYVGDVCDECEFEPMMPTNRRLLQLIATFFRLDEQAFNAETEMAFRYVRQMLDAI